MEENKIEDKEKMAEEIAAEEIDLKIEEIMKEEPSGNGKKKKVKKRKEKKERKPWSKKKKIIAAAAVLAVGFAGMKMMSGGAPAGMLVTTEPLQKTSIEEKLSVSGPVSGTDSIDVVSNLHTEVLEIRVKEGDKVKKGQVLAVLDKTDLEKEVEMAQNSYDLAVATQAEKEKEAKHGYEKASQDYKMASDQYQRLTALFETGSVSQVELETAKNTMDDARRQLESYQVENGVVKADASYALQVKNAEFELEKKKEDLENTEIKSGIDGTVVRVNAKVGRFADKIEEEKPMFIIENLDVLEMELKISEYSIGKIKKDQQVIIKADILNGQTVNGQVTAISPTGEEKGGGSTERVIPVTIRITDENTPLMAGITAKAEIILDSAEDAFVVPVSALIEKEDGYYIAAAENQQVHLMPVEKGVESDISVQVLETSGTILTEGMEIISNGSAEMTEGMAVTVMPSGM